MRSFSELTRREKQIEIVRWICVLPAALFGQALASVVVRMLVRTAMGGNANLLDNSPVAWWLVVILSHALPTAALVIAGAKMAPRRQIASAVGLTILGAARSLLIHIVVQHFAGNTVGRTNFVHFAAESLGLLAGAAWIAAEIAQRRQKATTPPSSS